MRLPTRRAVLYYSISLHGETAVSNRDRFVLQFWPKFQLLFTLTTLPLNQIRLSQGWAINLVRGSL